MLTLRKVFGTVSHAVLWQMLELGVAWGILNVIKSTYAHEIHNPTHFAHTHTLVCANQELQ